MYIFRSYGEVVVPYCRVLHPRRQ